MLNDEKNVFLIILFIFIILIIKPSYILLYIVIVIIVLWYLYPNIICKETYMGTYSNAALKRDCNKKPPGYNSKVHYQISSKYNKPTVQPIENLNIQSRMKYDEFFNQPIDITKRIKPYSAPHIFNSRWNLNSKWSHINEPEQPICNKSYENEPQVNNDYEFIDCSLNVNRGYDNTRDPRDYHISNPNRAYYNDISGTINYDYHDIDRYKMPNVAPSNIDFMPQFNRYEKYNMNGMNTRRMVEKEFIKRDLYKRNVIMDQVKDHRYRDLLNQNTYNYGSF